MQDRFSFMSATSEWYLFFGGYCEYFGNLVSTVSKSGVLFVSINIPNTGSHSTKGTITLCSF